MERANGVFYLQKLLNYLNFSFFGRKIYIFIDLIFFLIKTGYIQIDFDVIFLMQLSEFTKLLRCGGN